MTIPRACRTVRALFSAGCLGCCLVFPATAGAETVTFNFASIGTSFSAFLAPDNPLVGQEIISARIYLDVVSFPGSNAANFFTDISFPIDPLPGNENALVIFGSDFGWAGSGLFHHFEETTRFNGVFAPARYGGETPGEDFNGAVLSGSRIEFDFVPEPGTFFLLTLGAVRLMIVTRIRR